MFVLTAVILAAVLPAVRPFSFEYFDDEDDGQFLTCQPGYVFCLVSSKCVPTSKQGNLPCKESSNAGTLDDWLPHDTYNDFTVCQPGYIAMPDGNSADGGEQPTRAPAQLDNIDESSGGNRPTSGGSLVSTGLNATGTAGGAGGGMPELAE